MALTFEKSPVDSTQEMIADVLAPSIWIQPLTVDQALLLDDIRRNQ